MKFYKVYYLFFVIGLFIFGKSNAQNTCNCLYPDLSSEGDYMYFSSDKVDGIYQIFKYDFNNGSTIRLTNENDNCYFPTVGVNDTKVVFQRGSYGSSAEVFIMDSDGSNLLQLTNNGVYDGNPSFSPDGSQIIFDGWDDSAYPEVFIMDIDGGNRTQITNNSGAYWQSQPQFSSPGDYIYFLAGYNADDHIVRMNLDGSNWVDITPPNSFGYSDFGIDVNPNGESLLFSTSDYVGYNNGSDIVRTDAAGLDLERLTYSVSGEYFYRPRVETYTDKIYYSYYSGVGGDFWNISRMDLDGGNIESFLDCSAVSTKKLSESNNISIFPNPVMNKIFIQFDNEDISELKYELYDMLGRKLKFGQCDSDNSYVIDVSLLKNGFYVIQVQVDNKLFSEKVLVNR